MAWSNPTQCRPFFSGRRTPAHTGAHLTHLLSSERPPSPPAGPARLGRAAATVLAVGLALLGAAAAEAQDTTAPSNLTATQENGDVRLTWDAPLTDAASVTGYAIFRANPRLTPPAPLAIYLSNTFNDDTTYLDMEPIAGTRNTYRVAARRGSDASGNSNFAFVDVPPPSVSSVALTSTPTAPNPAYIIGDRIVATVTFDAEVDITGTPQLELDFAGMAKAATCAPATNTTTMVCEYEVAVNDSAPNGIAIAENKLTGGTITATGSTPAADRGHSAVTIDAGHKVDGIRPTLVTTGTAAPRTSTDGTQVILTFSENISTVDRTKITIGIGGGNVASTSAASVGADTTTVELDLSTFIDATMTLTVELAADAVFDAASNNNLAVSATGVTNAIEPPGRPAVPSVSSVANSTTSLEVTWTEPTNTGPAIDSYDLQYRQGTSGNFTAGPQNQSGTSATITGLTANTSYQVQVRATSSGGDSLWSPSASGQTNTAGNTAPTFSSSTATRNVAENSPARTNVGDPVTAADDDDDRLAYSLEGTDASSFRIVSASGQIRTSAALDYETKDSAIQVTVKADDGNGGTDTIDVTIASHRNVVEPPGPPTGLSVTRASATQVDLSVDRPGQPGRRRILSPTRSSVPSSLAAPGSSWWMDCSGSPTRISTSPRARPPITASTPSTAPAPPPIRSSSGLPGRSGRPAAPSRRSWPCGPTGPATAPATPCACTAASTPSRTAGSAATPC